MPARAQHPENRSRDPARPDRSSPGDPDPDDDATGSPGHEVDEPHLTVSATARRLGIAPATLRTWDRRYGLGPSAHTPGKHRRYSSDDVARLELMQHALVRGAAPAEAARYAKSVRLPGRTGDDAAAPADRPRAVPPPPDGTPGGEPGVEHVTREDTGDLGDPLLVADEDGHAASRVRVGGRVLRLPGAGRRARGLGRAALALDAATIRRLLAEAIAADGVVSAWDDVARPVLSAVAERWASTGAGVEIEHLVSECVIAVFGAHAGSAPPAENARPVLLAGMPGELHALPLVALGAALGDERVACRSLGPNLPSDAIVAAIRRTAPAAVVLWSQQHATADVGVIAALPRTRPRFRTFAAGPGWAEAELPPRVVRLDSLTHATDVVVRAVRN